MIGLALWLAVLAAVFVVWRGSTDRSESGATDAANGLPEPIVESTGEEGDSPSEPIVLDPQPAPEVDNSGWDEEGIEDFELTERSGRKITKSDLLGKPWAVCFIFTTCAGPCMGISAQIKALNDQLSDADVRFVTITVNPDYDTPEVLSHYADAFGADAEKWWFLTGDKAKIYGLIEHSFKMPVKEMQGEDRKPGWEVLHTTNILLVDAEGRVVDKFNGTSDTEMVSLRRAMLSLASGETQESTSGDVQQPKED